jgi:hypothetical protein
MIGLSMMNMKKFIESSGMQRRVVTLKLTDVSEVHTAALMMEAVLTSETSVNFNVTTQHYIPEDSKVHTCRRKNLKCHMNMKSLLIYSCTAIWFKL